MLRITNNYDISINAKAGTFGKLIEILPSDSYTFNDPEEKTIYVFTHINELEELIGSNREKLEPNPGDVVMRNGERYRAREVPRVEGNEAAEEAYNLVYVQNTTKRHDMCSPFILLGKPKKDCGQVGTEKDVTIGHQGIPPM